MAGIRALWAKVSPHLPQPASDAEALATIHRARTEARSIPLRLRAYSHRWLIDHALPSGLPDELKPRAERMYPRIVRAVGIAVRGISEAGRERAVLVREAMVDAVENAYADGITDSARVRALMTKARAGVR